MSKNNSSLKITFITFAVVGLIAALIYSKEQSQQTTANPKTEPPKTLTPLNAEQKLQNDMLDAADAKNGKKLSIGCGPCHSFTEDNVGKIGPNLLEVFGRKVASKSDYEYSDALKKHQEKHWNAHELNEWLTDPAEYAPGTKMAFGGISDPQDRADIIAFIMSLKAKEAGH